MVTAPHLPVIYWYVVVVAENQPFPKTSARQIRKSCKKHAVGVCQCWRCVKCITLAYKRVMLSIIYLCILVTCVKIIRYCSLPLLRIVQKLKGLTW